MTCPKCERYDDCDAPLCPRDEQTRDGGWFPDEPICPLRRLVPDWVRLQRKLAKRLGGRVEYFTIAMLEAVQYPSRVKYGLDPDAVPEIAEKQWFRKHGKVTRKRTWSGGKAGARGPGTAVGRAPTQAEDSEPKEVA